MSTIQNLLNRYQLNPLERRLIILTATALFIAINLYIIRPHLTQWSQTTNQINQTQQQLRNYQNHNQKQPQLKQQLTQLEQTNPPIPPAQRANQLLQTIQQKARTANLPQPNINHITHNPNTKPNQQTFFEQQAYRLTVQTTNTLPIIQFLIAIASHDSIIRVRDLTLKPAKHQLTTTMTLVAHYQPQPTNNNNTQ